MLLASQRRPIDEAERRYFQSQRAALVRWRSGLWRNCLWVYALVCSLAALTILADRKHPMIGLLTDAVIFTSFWIVFGTVVGVRTIVRERRKLAKRIRDYEQALQTGMCSDLRIQARRVWEFEELDDEGACYAFQLESGGVAFVEGQEFYAGARFPNNDFSLVEFQTAGGLTLDELYGNLKNA